MKREIKIWSEGVRLAGDLHQPDDLKPGDRRAAILLCHGWGGTKEHLNDTYATLFAKAGFVVMTFDYRGWFESDARLVSIDKQPAPDENGQLTVSVRAIREVVDPLDQLQDITACLDWLCGEECVDSDKIGIWGSSYGGGHAIMLAATDSRIKCMVSQVGPVGSMNLDLLAPEAAPILQLASTKARGTNAIMPSTDVAHETLVGHPDWAKMSRYHPIEEAHRIKVPCLFLDQAEEELMDPTQQYPKVMEVISPDVPTRHHTFSGTHYDIYDKNYREGSRMALEWFETYLA